VKLWTSKNCHTHPRVAAAQMACHSGQIHLSADIKGAGIMYKQQALFNRVKMNIFLSKPNTQ